MAIGWKQNYFRYREYFLNIVGSYQKKQSFRVFLELVLTVVTIAIFSVFALKPTIIAISGLLNEIKAREATVSFMDTKINNIQTAQNLERQYQDQLGLLSTALPDSTDPQGFVSQMEATLGSPNITVIGLNIADAQIVGPAKIAGSATGYLPFSLSVTGQYETLLDLITTLENTRRPLIIQNFSMTVQNKDVSAESNGTVIFSVNGEAANLK